MGESYRVSGLGFLVYKMSVLRGGLLGSLGGLNKLEWRHLDVLDAANIFLYLVICSFPLNSAHSVIHGREMLNFNVKIINCLLCALGRTYLNQLKVLRSLIGKWEKYE